MPAGLLSITPSRAACVHPRHHIGGMDCRREIPPTSARMSADKLALRLGLANTSCFRTPGCKNLSCSVDRTRSSRSWNVRSPAFLSTDRAPALLTFTIPLTTVPLRFRT
ncbi:unnamed protein product [Ectocarpus sp. 6 AP-2014]